LRCALAEPCGNRFTALDWPGLSARLIALGRIDDDLEAVLRMVEKALGNGLALHQAVLPLDMLGRHAVCEEQNLAVELSIDELAAMIGIQDATGMAAPLGTVVSHIFEQAVHDPV